MQNTAQSMNHKVGCILVLAVAFFSQLGRAQSLSELRWGGDAEGGSPFVEADPRDPTRVVGFEVEIAGILADGLGRQPRFIQVGFTTLDAAAARGDFDIGLSGIEDSPARQSRLAVTIPYYQFREVLTVRDVDAPRYRTLADLRGRRVATLGATLAYDLLVQAQSEVRLSNRLSMKMMCIPYTDLILGRVDAVLLDDVLAERGVRRNPGLTNQTTDVGIGYYVGITAPDNAALRDRMNEILLRAMKDGRLESIFRRWNMWNDDQPLLYARLLSGETGTAVDRTSAAPPLTAGRRRSAIFRRWSCRGDHVCAVVLLHGTRHCAWRVDREWKSVRTADRSHALDRLGRA